MRTLACRAAAVQQAVLCHGTPDGPAWRCALATRLSDSSSARASARRMLSSPSALASRTACGTGGWLRLRVANAGAERQKCAFRSGVRRRFCKIFVEPPTHFSGKSIKNSSNTKRILVLNTSNKRNETKQIATKTISSLVKPSMPHTRLPLKQVPCGMAWKRNAEGRRSSQQGDRWGIPL